MKFRQVGRLIGLAAVGLLVVSGCEEETTTGVPVAESMVASGGDNQSGTVGSVLPTSLEVTVTGSNGQPFSGATVQFSVQSRTGSVNPSSATTGSDGKASTSLTLGTIAERVSVEARAGELTAEFSATALAGPVTSVEAVGGGGQNGGTGGLLAEVLAVRLTDATGNPVPGVEPAWSTPNGGTFAATASDAEGVARAAWTLGPSGGSQSALASASGGSAGFTAAAFAPCASAGAPAATAITIGASPSSVIGDANTSCVLPTGQFAEFYSVTPAAAAAASFAVSTTAFSPVLRALDGSGRSYAIAPNTGPAGSSNTNLATVVLGAGVTYLFQVTPTTAGSEGAYTLQTAAVAVDNNRGCADGGVFLAPGVTTTQTITATDCDFFAGFFSDWWSVYLEAGQSISLTQTGVTFDPWIVGFSPAGATFFNDGCPGAGVGLVAGYTAAETGIHLFDIGTCNGAATGSYTLAYTISSPSAPQGVAQARARQFGALTLEELRDQVRRDRRK